MVDTKLDTGPQEALDKMLGRWPGATVQRVWSTAKNTYVLVAWNDSEMDRAFPRKYYWCTTQAYGRRKPYWKGVG